MRVTVEDASGGKVVIDGDDLEKATAEAEPEPWDGSTVAGQLIKSEPERRFTLCVAYPADKPDKSVAQDGFRDFASKSATEQAAWDFLANSPEIGLFHAPGTEGAGRVVESYLWRADPWVIKSADGTECTVSEGDWLLGILWGEAGWDLVKTGKITGVSMQGGATRRKPSPEALARLRR